MLGMILLLASQQAVEVTPSLNSLTLSTGSLGTCVTHPLQPAQLNVAWTSTNFNSALHDYKVYRDGVLVNTTDTLSYTLVLAGLVENACQHPQDIIFNYRVDIVRTSDSVVLASKSASVTKSYGDCVGAC